MCTISITRTGDLSTYDLSIWIEFEAQQRKNGTCDLTYHGKTQKEIQKITNKWVEFRDKRREEIKRQAKNIGIYGFYTGSFLFLFLC